MDPIYYYHPTEAPTGRRFTDEAEVAALGPEWVDTPTNFPLIASVSPPATEGPADSVVPDAVDAPAVPADAGRRPGWKNWKKAI